MSWRDATISAGVLPGWEPLVDELYDRVIKEAPELVVSQVKEKFGGLRFYYFLPKETSERETDVAYVFFNKKTVGDLVREIVSSAEQASFWICELCGKAGARTSVSKHGWLKTLCVDCTKLRDESDKPVWQIAEEIRNACE